MVNHLVLYGPPGTGKTRRLLRHVGEFMIRKPTRVLFCSHTRAAAMEATSRFTEPSMMPRMDIQTLHSVCFRALGLSKAQTVDDTKLQDFEREYGIDMSDQGLGKEFLGVLDLSRARLQTPDEGYEQSWRPGSAEHFRSFVASYNNWKKQFGYKDFTDMLTDGADNIQAAAVNYGLIAIDEAQDLTPLHWRVVDRLHIVNPRAHILIAGDDDQALYSFAGADPMGMTKFGEDLEAKTEVLSQSYRITQQVHDVAHAIIKRVASRVDKAYAPRTGLDGKPAQGVYEVWPHMDHMALSRERDTLVLYADRFVRSEVEPILQEQGYCYRALNGYPSPLDSRAGKAMRVVLTHNDADILADDDLRNAVRGGLSRRGIDIWENVSERETLVRMRRWDLPVLTIKPQHIDYFRAVDWEAQQNVRISTMHGAKGLQADDVHIILSLSEAAWRDAGVAPDHLHRLLYTAVTRAKENLYIYDGENGYELPAEYR